MDRGEVNIISHLYFEPSILDADTERLIYCNVDTMQPLSGSGVIIIERGMWRLAPGVVGFLKLAEGSLDQLQSSLQRSLATVQQECRLPMDP